MKVMTIVGTRPELIRLSRVIHRLDATESIDHVLVHTGQNYDYTLNQVFFEDLGIRPPDHMLGVDTTSVGTVLGGTLIASERIMLEEAPDAVLVLGDTNSCIAALMARRLKIPVYHMEAGNRCFDLNVPEETNRRLVDHISDFNLVYTEHARRNLLAEGIHPRNIMLTGSPMKEVLESCKNSFSESSALERAGVRPGEYILVSTHRAENVDDPERFSRLLDVLVGVHNAHGLRMLISTHPRTRARLISLGRDMPAGFHFAEPYGFIDYIRLQQEAFCVLSDSGTISEESALLGFPAITLRDSMERPEALDAGAIIMTGMSASNALQGIELVTGRAKRPTIPAEYQIDNCSERTVNFIVSTCERYSFWSGLR